MKKILQLSVVVVLLGLMSFTISPPEYEDCRIMHEGTFLYGDINKPIRVVINGENHTEYYEGGKYVIQSKLNWVNPCEYNMTMTKVTIPNFPNGIGDIMNVRIEEVKGDQIYYTASVNGKTWKGRFFKLVE